MTASDTPELPDTEVAATPAIPTELDRGDGLPVRKVISTEQLRGLSRRSLLVGGAAVAAGVVGFRTAVTGELVGRTPKLLRSSYEFNEDIWSALTDIDRLAPEFAFAESAMPIVNGRRGIEDDIDVDAWKLAIRDVDGSTMQELTLADIKQLPFTETIFEFKCIEGWSEITAFGGVRVSDLIAAVAPGKESHPHVGLNTPNAQYPVSVDMQTMLHPQTLLAYEMQRAPLTQGHGAPLRLCTPLKYGIKNIRRPGSFQFADEPQRDFWGERGYSDWVGL